MKKYQFDPLTFFDSDDADEMLEFDESDGGYEAAAPEDVFDLDDDEEEEDETDEIGPQNLLGEFDEGDPY